MQGRFFVDSNTQPDSWFDVVVVGDPANAKEKCESILAGQQDNLARAPLTVRVERACDKAALPDVPAKKGESVLVTRYPLPPPESSDGGYLVRWTRFPNNAECEAVRKKVADATVKSDAALAQAQKDFVHEQLPALEARAKGSCGERDQAKGRCDGLRKQKASAEKRCKTRKCDEARRLTVELAQCEIVMEQAQRQCAIDEDVLALTRKREAEPPPEQTRPPPVCRDF